MKWFTLTVCVLCYSVNFAEMGVTLREDSTRVGECKPYTMYQDNCNVCTCSHDGVQYKCTESECMDYENQDAEVFMEQKGDDHIERHSICRPYDTFEIGCNTCSCNDDGTDYTCTIDKCLLPEDVEVFAEIKEDKPISPLRVCVPNKIFEDGCNRCWCNDKGTEYDCTKKICNQDDKNTDIKNRTVCVAKTSFKKDCNICWCNDFGTGYFCTRRVCVPEDPEEVYPDEKSQEWHIIMKKCRPAEVFEIDCNTCMCNRQGDSFACTKRICSNSEIPYDEVIENVQQPSDIAETRRKRETDQPQPPVKWLCEAGETFRLDCNTCLCDTNGANYSCTRKDCLHPPPEDSYSRKPRSLPRAENYKCIPGSSFMDEDNCNNCWCSTDGMQVYCTLKLCWNINYDENDVIKGECMPGQEMSMKGRSCICSSDSKKFICRDTPSINTYARKSRSLSRAVNLKCIPNSFFKDDKNCNRCWCKKNGLHASCTDKECHGTKYYDDKNVYHGMCTPGELVEWNSRRCICAAGGNKSFCTNYV